MTAEIHNETDFKIPEEMLLGLTSHVLKTLHVHPESEVSIIFVNDKSIAQLNNDWMGVAEATDVLSFPMDELRPGRPDAVGPQGLLGDIVISPEVAAVQAIAAGHTIDVEMATLLTHGLLHLLGFDHVTPFEEEEMFQLQNELLATFDSKNMNNF